MTYANRTTESARKKPNIGLGKGEINYGTPLTAARRPVILAGARNRAWMCLLIKDNNDFKRAWYICVLDEVCAYFLLNSEGVREEFLNSSSQRNLTNEVGKTPRKNK